MLDILIEYGLLGAFLLLVIGLILLIGGGEILVRGASRLAITLGISPLVVGLTIVAICTSAPELAVSVTSSLYDRSGMALGNVVGSNICNVCLILGLAAVLRPLQVSASLLRREIPLMIFLSFVVLIFGYLGGLGNIIDIIEGRFDGRITRFEGAVLTLGMVAYLMWTVYEIRKNPKQDAEYIAEMEGKVLGDNATVSMFGITGRIVASVCGIIIGLGLLLLGSDMLIKSGTRIAIEFGVSELVIGLTVLAVGTSLPELVVSVVAVLRKKSDIAIGNVVGSNIFNILGVLGLSAFVSPQGLEVDHRAMQFDIPAMIVTSIFCIILCFTGQRINRFEGIFLLLIYAMYIGLACLA
ncbi:MAG: calcium/sodium antiporter [Planctomycetaceae bacterium]|nr:calcium/sodium antiporter [Planctomycetaceae bacterium]